MSHRGCLLAGAQIAALSRHRFLNIDDMVGVTLVSY
jgi:hypothetical protein